ncbi:MAG: Mov34/MPN/PAD-1 family protein, partial [Planctomycetaceae bacterium]|nr:Mov34/MPN/PAD-1 family protein [Planctomycetaceae bacterium]
MSGVDISDLKKEKLSDGQFPAKPKSDFRFHITEAVHKDIQNHAKADKSVEICGVLVGKWEKDENGPFALVTENIRCDSATSKFAEVTFTHESWSHINAEMDSKYSDLRIIGWYHSHPDFGIFLSDRDVFIHENFFSGAGQVAYVVDPVRDLEGVFTWKDGKPEPIAHYWIGDRIRTVDAVTRSTAPPQMSPVAAPGAANSQPALEEPSFLPFLTTCLAWMSLFLLGYLVGGLRPYPDQTLIEQGAVARFGYTKLMKLGLKDELTAVQQHTRDIYQEFEKLPTPSAELSEEELAEAQERRKLIVAKLALHAQAVELIKNKYSLTSAEKLAVQRLIEENEAELQGTALAKKSSSEETKTAPA